MTLIRIVQAQGEKDVQIVRALFWEYLSWANEMNEREFDLRLDIAKMLEEDMADLGKFMPPYGRLLIAQSEGDAAGCVCLKKLSQDVGEVKRLYVRPAFRSKGMGKMLVANLLREAWKSGYCTLRLDSTRYMGKAHALYRSFGFEEREPYPESEIPEEYHEHWVFMELALKEH